MRSRASLFVRMAANREFFYRFDKERNIVVTTDVLGAAVGLHLQDARELAERLRALGLECSITNSYGEPIG